MMKTVKSEQKTKEIFETMSVPVALATMAIYVCVAAGWL